MIRGAIFDIDGVLLDSMGIWEDLGERYLRSLGLEGEKGLGDILFPMSMKQGAGYLKEHYNLKTDVNEIVLSIQKMLEDYYFHEVCAKPGAKEILLYLKERNIKIVCATSSPYEHVKKALERNSLLEYIDRIFTVDEAGEGKDSAKIYNIAAKYLNEKPSNIMVFEDSLFAVKTAKAAGFFTVGVYDQKGEKDKDGIQKIPDRFIKDLRDHSDLIKCER